MPLIVDLPTNDDLAGLSSYRTLVLFFKLYWTTGVLQYLVLGIMYNTLGMLTTCVEFVLHLRGNIQGDYF